MKQFFLLIFLFTACSNVFAQQHASCKDVFNIVELERKQFEKKSASELRSLASNNFTVHHYRCKWKIDPAIRYIDGEVTPEFIITASASNIVFNFTNQLMVDSVIFRNGKTTFSQSPDNTLSINFNVTLNAGAKDSVSIFYHGIPPLSQDFTGGFIQSTHNNVPVLWTLSEPYNAKNWWPCRNGLDDKADSIDIFITHPAEYKASSNGVLQSTITTSGSTTTLYKHRYPIASYLVALAVTNYSVFTRTVTISDTTLPVTSYVYPENLLEFQTATDVVLNALKLYSDSLTNYPFLKEKYGQTQFGWGGGMEHQTNSFLVDTGEILMAHELAHQWFGDKVTCKSWQDIWLNEGFATYLADFFYTENFDTAAYSAYVSYVLASIVSQPDGSVWVDDTTNVNRIFDGRLSYNKGSFLLRMLRFTLGDSVFFQGLRNYLNDSALAYGFATTADFQRNMEQVSGTDLTYFFDQWFYGEGYPSFRVNWYQAPDRSINLRVSETTSDTSVKFFKLKLPLTFKNGNLQKEVAIDVTENNQYITIPNPGFGVDETLIDPESFFISKDNVSYKVPFIDYGGE